MASQWTRRTAAVRVVELLLAALVLAALLLVAAPPAAGASPAPAGATPAPGATRDLTGHWAIAGTSGIDLVQHGTSLTGTSVAGISVSGTVDGERVTFRWWHGAAFDQAKAANRGTGTMQVSADGERLKIAAKGEDAGPGPFPTKYEAVRVHNIVTTPSPAPWSYGSWWDGLDGPTIFSLTRARLDYLVESWVLCLQTGYWPSPAVAWIKVEDEYAKNNTLIPGGWLPNGGGPVLLNPAYRP